MSKARIEVNWDDEADESSARSAVEFGLDYMMEGLIRRQIVDPDIDLTLDPPRHPRIGIGCVIIHQGKLLMLLRAGAHGAGTWSIPGGHLEWGESPEETAEREVLEETGVVVRAVKRLPYTGDFFAAEDRHYITLFILCEYVSGEPTVLEPDKCTEVWWILLGGVTCRDLFLPLQHFLDDNPDILRQLSQAQEP